MLTVSFGHMIHDVYSSFLAPLIPLLVEKLGIPLSMAGMLDTVRNSPSLFNPLFGLLADRIRVKYLVIVMPAVTTVIMSLIGTAPTYAVAVIMIFIMGVSSVLFHIPSPVIIKDLSGDKIGMGMSFYMLGGELSRSLGPLIITGAITIWGLEGTWRLIPFGIGASLVLFYILRNYDTEVHNAEARDREKPVRSRSGLIPLFSSIGGFLFFIMAMKMSLTLYLPAYLVHRGETLISASLLLSILQFSGAVGTLFAGSISDKVGRKTILYISAGACPVLMWMFLVSDEVFRIPILAALGFFLFAYGPVLLAVVQGTDHDAPSFVNGVYMTVTFLIRGLIVFLVGHYIGQIGYEIIYRIAAVLAIGALPFVYFIPEDKKTAAAAGEAKGLE